jgi:pilus assembly protein FimV
MRIKTSSRTRCIINFRFLCFSAFSALFFSSQALALGFGEIKLHSRVGEPLNAEVPIHGGSSSEIATTCFSLSEIRNAELPVVTAARTRLVRVGQNFNLLITSSYPISEPVFMIGLRADCGIDLQRNYVLIPAAPLSAENPRSQSIINTADRNPAQKLNNFLKWSAQDGDTLESIAESKTQGSAAEQSRLLAAINRANPDLKIGQRLAKGTFVRIPNLAPPVTTKRRPHSEASTESPKRQDNEARPAPWLKKPLHRNRLADLDPKGGDRVLLSGPPETFILGQPSLDSPSAISEMEGRMLKLETSLHTLNLQVDNLNAALEVTAEAMALRQKLRVTQSQNSAIAPTLSSDPTPPAANNASMENWLELLLGTLAGGGISAGIAHLLSRRHGGAKPDYQRR